jgi:hypothetical protein
LAELSPLVSKIIFSGKRFFLFTPRPDPLPLKGRRDKRKELLAMDRSGRKTKDIFINQPPSGLSS